MADKDEHHYGGQAVIEGVMLRGKQDYAVAGSCCCTSRWPDTPGRIAGCTGR